MNLAGAVRALLLAMATGVASGCPWNAAGTTGCKPVGNPSPLPEVIHESSGIAPSLTLPGVLWTHNDGPAPTLYAVNEDGKLLATIPVSGTRMRDWEDLATGPCEGGSCLYLADTGDNTEVRPRLQLLRIQEPGSLEDSPLEAQAFPVVLPDGPRDIEAIFVLPGEQIHLVTKGRNHANTVYRYPPPLRPGEAVTLQEIQTLSDGPMSIPAQVTGADASPDGKLVVVRSYRDMTFYRVEEGLLVPLSGGTVALRTLQEPQGEGVAFGAGDRLFLTTEAGNFGGVAAIRILECGLPH